MELKQILTGTTIGFVAGIIVTLVFSGLYWNAQLAEQLAQKDTLVKEIRADASRLAQSNADLTTLNQHMQATMEQARTLVSQLGTSTDDSIERIKKVVANLKTLKQLLETPNH